MSPARRQGGGGISHKLMVLVFFDNVVVCIFAKTTHTRQIHRSHRVHKICVQSEQAILRFGNHELVSEYYKIIIVRGGSMFVDFLGHQSG